MKPKTYIDDDGEFVVECNNSTYFAKVDGTIIALDNLRLAIDHAYRDGVNDTKRAFRELMENDSVD